MKKVAILIYDDSLTGGAEKAGKGIAEELSKFTEVHVITLFNDKKNNELSKKYKHFVVSDKTISITKNLFKLSKKVKKYLKENEIDVLLAITAGVNTIAILSTRNTNIKTVYCEHSNLENRTYGKKHILRQYLGAKYMDKIVTLTQRDKENFKKFFKVQENKLLSIPNWFETNINNTEYNKESNKIITAGRLVYVKGYDMLLQVAKLIHEKHPEWHWDIYGDGEEKNNIIENIHKLNLDDFITLMGNVSNMEEVYKKYSFYVLTSYYEGIPLVLLEAQSAKLPIVAFDCPTGPSEIVENGKNGYLVECYNIQEMADKIITLIENENIRNEFSNNSDMNKEKFNKESIIEQWKQLINSL